MRNLALGSLGLGMLDTSAFAIGKNLPPEELKVGIVGLSVHSAAFSQILNYPNKNSDLAGCRITALYHPPGNPDVDFTQVQLDKFEEDIVAMGVKIVGSMDEMIDMVDVVMIETNDGRPHLDEVLPAFKAGIPVFVDKPVAATLPGVLQLYEKAREYKVPVFTSSALRYVDNVKQINKEEVLSAFTYSPAALEKSHTDLFWYGIHGVELLYAAMGAGCTEVMQVQHSDKEDLVIGYWNNNRTGSFRGIRSGRGGFGGTVFMANEIVTLDPFTGYRSLVVKIVEFFKTNIPPVSMEETIEIYTFMEAAQQSKRRGGVKISLEKTLKNAYKSIK